MRQELRAHYRPANIIEEGYVNRLAEHAWLRQRCFELQVNCYDPRDCKSIKDKKQFALLIRYQKENECAMDKCVNMLSKLRAAHRKEENGFESEKRKAAEEIRRGEFHQARLRLTNARAGAIEITHGVRQTVSTLRLIDEIGRNRQTA